MLNTNINLSLPNIDRVEKNTTSAMVFRVLNYYFALPLEAIIKIITCPAITSPIRDGLGLVEWDRQTITVVDLADKLQIERTEFTANKTSHRFLILTQTTSAQLCGFLIEQSPTLINIPGDSIRSVPLSYRQVADLSVIKQMAIVPRSLFHFFEREASIELVQSSESAETLKIFLLGEWHHFS
jgi:purine-binding chemotaxis protein CheW